VDKWTSQETPFPSWPALFSVCFPSVCPKAPRLRSPLLCNSLLSIILQVFWACTLLCPPLFYLLAAEKERLKALKQWCLLKSNRVTVMLRHGGPAYNGPGPESDGSGPINIDTEVGERQERGDSPSQAGAGHPGQAEELDPSQEAGTLKAMKQWFRLKSNQVIELQGGPSNDGTGPEHDVIVSRVMMSSCHDGPGDRHQGLAATGQGSGEKQD
jgi:hypothetical protein